MEILQLSVVYKSRTGHCVPVKEFMVQILLPYYSELGTLGVSLGLDRRVKAALEFSSFYPKVSARLRAWIKAKLL